MKEKPSGIEACAALLVLAPWLSILAVAMGLNHSAASLRLGLFDELSIGYYLFFGLPALMGLALFFVKRQSLWVMHSSLFVLFAYSVWVVSRNLDSTFNLLFISNLLLVVYLSSFFVRRSVRKVFLDSKIRWWETRPRFRVKLNAKIQLDGTPSECQIQDFSEGGAFVSSAVELPKQRPFQLEFSALARTFNLPVEVLYFSQSENGYGLKFLPPDRATQLEVKSLCVGLKKVGLMTRNSSASFRERVLNWLREL